MKTKRIKSKKEKNWIRIDIAFIILCFVLMEIRTRKPIIGVFVDYIKVYKGNMISVVNIIIAYVWMLSLSFIVGNFIIIAIYLAFRIARMKVIKENSKYQVIDNIEYYRDRFDNITPAEISLITDLEIETKKDISASILDLYQKQIIDFSNNTIVICDETKISKQSEKTLIEMILNNDFNKENIEKWKNDCTEEAIKDNYIKTKVNMENQPVFKKMVN